MEHKKFKTLSSEPVFVNKWWNIVHEKVELGDGTTGDWWVNLAQSGVLVFALTEGGKVVVNRQYKHGISEVVTELCIGMVDGDDGGPLAEAKRELMEETGYGGGDWEALGSFASNPTSSRSRVHMFMARGVRKMAEPVHDPREVVETSEVALEELVAMIDRGEFSTSAAMAGIFLALRKLGKLEFKV